MQLSEFIKTSLIAIVDGVNQASGDIREKGGSVNPLGNPDRTGLRGRMWSHGCGVVEMVEFDVAVTEESSGGTSGGIGVFLGPVGVGVKGESAASRGSLSRIQFRIPLLLPVGRDIRKERHRDAPQQEKALPSCIDRTGL